MSAFEADRFNRSRTSPEDQFPSGMAEAVSFPTRSDQYFSAVAKAGTIFRDLRYA